MNITNTLLSFVEKIVGILCNAKESHIFRQNITHNIGFAYVVDFYLTTGGLNEKKNKK